MNDLAKVRDRVSNPFIYVSPATHNVLLILYECETLKRAEEARKHYKSEGIDCFIQVKVA